MTTTTLGPSRAPGPVRRPARDCPAGLGHGSLVRAGRAGDHHNGHAPGHGAVFLPDTGVLVAGDMLSDIEIPLLDTTEDDPLGDYRAGLERLAAVSGVRWLVPGHGHVGDAEEFRRRLDADIRYLNLPAAGRPFDDPRCTEGWQRKHHAHQRRCVTGGTRGDLPG